MAAVPPHRRWISPTARRGPRSERFGSVGCGHNFTTGLFGSLSLTYDNSQAFLVRSGFTLHLH